MYVFSVAPSFSVCYIGPQKMVKMASTHIGHAKFFPRPIGKWTISWNFFKFCTGLANLRSGETFPMSQQLIPEEHLDRAVG